jgi:hypothetical protein
MPDHEQYLIPGTETMVSKSAHDIVQRAFDNEEPVFVIRARDNLSIAAINAYLISGLQLGADPEFLAEIQKIHQAMLTWRLEHMNEVRMPTNG